MPNMSQTPVPVPGKMPRVIMEKEFERKRAFDVVKRMEEEKFSLGACEWGARGFASIAGSAMTTQNAESMADFLDDGGCEALVQIMNKFAESSQVVSAYGCLAVCILAWSLRELKEFLGEIGAGEIVVFATSMHIGDPLVSEFGTRAIALLANQNISNSFRLAQAGACDAVAQAGNFGFNLRHERALDVATNVCTAFAELAEAANSQKLLDCGASALVVELTKYHHKQIDYAKAAVKVLCALASLNAVHREELGRCDACPLVVRMLYIHDDVALCLEGCEAIMHLSLSPSNAKKLGDCSGCEVVVTMLRNKLMEADYGAEVCTGAMLNLALYGERAKQNRQQLLSSGAIDLLRKAQFSTKASYKARENIVTLLDLLAAEVGSASNPLGNGNAASSSGGMNGLSSSSQDSTATAGSRSTTPVNPYSYHTVVPANANGDLISIIHGSEMKGDTVPLKVEVREVVEYASLVPFQKRSPSPGDGDNGSSADHDYDAASSSSISRGAHGVVEL